MPYQASKPDLFLSKSLGQEDILGNFQAFNIAWNWDHTPFDSAHNGWHEKTSLAIPNTLPQLPTDNIVLSLAAGDFTYDPRLLIKRGDPAEEYSIRRWVSTDGKTWAWRTFSNILVKSSVRISINSTNGDYEFILPQIQEAPLFTDIYFIQPSVLNSIPGTDSNADVLVTGWTISATQEKINLRIWRRNLNGTAGTDRPPILVNFLLIGKG